MVRFLTLPGIPVVDYALHFFREFGRPQDIAMETATSIVNFAKGGPWAKL